MRHHSKDTPKNARIITLYKENAYNYQLSISPAFTLADAKNLQRQHDIEYVCDFVTQGAKIEPILKRVESESGIHRSKMHVKTYLYRLEADPFSGLK